MPTPARGTAIALSRLAGTGTLLKRTPKWPSELQPSQTERVQRATLSSVVVCYGRSGIWLLRASILDRGNLLRSIYADQIAPIACSNQRDAFEILFRRFRINLRVGRTY